MSNEWISLKFSDICYNRNVSVKKPIEAGIERYIGLEHLKPEELKISSWGLTSQGTTFTRVFSPGQVLFGKRRSYQKKAALADFSGVCSGDILVFEANEELIIPELLPYIVQNESFFDYAVGTSSGSLSPRTSWKHLSNYSLRIPKDKKVQSKILTQLLKLENGLESKKQLIGSIKLYKKKLMEQLLTKGISNSEFKKTELGEIPTGWKIKELGELCVGKPTYGINKPAVEYSFSLPRYVRITDISDNGKLLKADIKSVDTQNEDYYLNEGDLVFARTGATVGKTYLYDRKDEQCVFAGYLIKFTPDTKYLLPEYLFQYTHSEQYYRWVKSTLKEGAQPNINSKEYSSLLLALPTVEEQKKITEILLDFDLQIERFEQQYIQLREIKKSFLFQLF